MKASPPAIAATIVGAPNIAAIPAATPSIKPHDTLPVKKPIPREIIAKAAKALPPLPVAILNTLHKVVTKAFSFAVLVLIVIPVGFGVGVDVGGLDVGGDVGLLVSANLIIVSSDEVVDAEALTLKATIDAKNDKTNNKDILLEIKFIMGVSNLLIKLIKVVSGL